MYFKVAFHSNMKLLKVKAELENSHNFLISRSLRLLGVEFLFMLMISRNFSNYSTRESTIQTVVVEILRIFRLFCFLFCSGTAKITELYRNHCNH